jgi:hypothetical protein
MRHRHSVCHRHQIVGGLGGASLPPSGGAGAEPPQKTHLRGAGAEPPRKRPTSGVRGRALAKNHSNISFYSSPQ